MKQWLKDAALIAILAVWAGYYAVRNGLRRILP